MEVFDMANVKREPLDEFQPDNSYLDSYMQYGNDVFDTQPVDWLSSLVEDRSTHSLDHIGHISEYPNVALNSLNRDQTLNRLNGLSVNQRGVHEEISANNFNAYKGSPIAAEFDHRLDSGAQDLDPDVKSFYSTQQFYTQSLNTVENVMEFCNDTLKGPAKTEFIVQYDEDEGIRLSDHGSDRDSESGYDSGAHSPTSETPSTPPRCLMLTQMDNDGSGSSTGDETSPRGQIQSRQPFFLSEEEKRTLITEGLPIPAGYPLTKSEERALKKVRRKIKNKISAQESRRKKKEYMETLEKRVELCSNENLDLRKKLDSMEAANRTLISQLQKLQAIVASKVSRPTSTISTQTMSAEEAAS